MKHSPATHTHTHTNTHTHTHIYVYMYIQADFFMDDLDCPDLYCMYVERKSDDYIHMFRHLRLRLFRSTDDSSRSTG
jgi:hypothetical protein